jgi:hypothetical protein
VAVLSFGFGVSFFYSFFVIQNSAALLLFLLLCPIVYVLSIFKLVRKYF